MGTLGLLTMIEDSLFTNTGIAPIAVIIRFPQTRLYLSAGLANLFDLCVPASICRGFQAEAFQNQFAAFCLRA